MNELERFEELAGMARGEPSPLFDVTSAVLRRLSSRTVSDRIFLVMSLGSAAAASVSVAFALHAWLSMADPLVEILEPLVMVMQ